MWSFGLVACWMLGNNSETVRIAFHLKNSSIQWTANYTATKHRISKNRSCYHCTEMVTHLLEHRSDFLSFQQEYTMLLQQVEGVRETSLQQNDDWTDRIRPAKSAHIGVHFLMLSHDWKTCKGCSTWWSSNIICWKLVALFLSSLALFDKTLAQIWNSAPEFGDKWWGQNILPPWHVLFSYLTAWPERALHGAQS